VLLHVMIPSSFSYTCQRLESQTLRTTRVISASTDGSRVQ